MLLSEFAVKAEAFGANAGDVVGVWKDADGVYRVAEYVHGGFVSPLDEDFPCVPIQDVVLFAIPTSYAYAGRVNDKYTPIGTSARIITSDYIAFTEWVATMANAVGEENVYIAVANHQTSLFLSLTRACIDGHAIGKAKRLYSRALHRSEDAWQEYNKSVDEWAMKKVSESDMEAAYERAMLFQRVTFLAWDILDNVKTLHLTGGTA